MFLFKHTRLREEATEIGSASGFSLYGFPELRQNGLNVQAGFGESKSGFVRLSDIFLRRLSLLQTGYSGNPRAVLPHLSQIRRASGLVATSNNVALPLLQLKRFGLVRAPILLISVGLEAYKSDTNSRRCRRLSRLLQYADRVLVFSNSERDFLADRLKFSDQGLKAVPYGFSSRYFPNYCEERSSKIKILTVGADAQRDVELLREWSLRNPDSRIQAVLSRELVERLPNIPESWDLQEDVPLHEVFSLLSNAEKVVIPVKRNRYTAGTTFLLQSLAAGVPTLVARTGALTSMPEAEPFPFLTYEPEDAESFAEGMRRLRSLSDEEMREISRAGRRWVERWGDGSILRNELEDFVEQCAEA